MESTRTCVNPTKGSAETKVTAAPTTTSSFEIWGLFAGILVHPQIFVDEFVCKLGHE